MPSTETTLALSQRLLLLCDDFTNLRLLGVERDVILPFIRNVILVENGFYRALRYTGLAIDALVGVNVQHGLTLVKTFDGTNNNTICIAATIAGLGNYVSHLG